MGGARRVLLIANPAAGQGRARRRAESVAAALRRHGVLVSIAYTAGRGDAARLARARGVDADVVAPVGGDGTLREVLEGLPIPGPRLGMVPAGTGNTFAKALGLPRDPERAAEVLRGDAVRDLDLCLANGLRFLCFAGVGFDAEVLVRLEELRGARGGVSLYPVPVLRALAGYHAPRLRITADGEPPLEAGIAILANIRRWAAFFDLPEDVAPDDGVLDCLALGVSSRRRLVGDALRIVTGRLETAPDLRRVRGRRIVVESEDPVHFHIDGDVAGSTPVTFEVEPGAVAVAVPAW